ncbi:DNA translocase FtsK [Cupriavidus sp. YAF13]|uniref:DNA translocase FtsK n=1 Tax=Cupriavidus sp. YAF13 TaxID=3233075 RepID=UPI003F932151
MNEASTGYPDLVAAATAVLVAEQSVSIALLQRKFRLDYNDALSLMDTLEKRGVVSAPHFNHLRTLTPAYMKPLATTQALSEREKHIRRVFETALFLWEAHEEGQGGNTKAIRILSPHGNKANTRQQRNVVFATLDHAQHRSLLTAASALANWLPHDRQGTVDHGDIMDELTVLCLVENRGYQRITDREEKIERSYVRLARYIRRILTEGTPPNTEIFLHFIPNEFVPRGKGKDGPGWEEHVVPRKYLLQTCLELFKAGWSVQEVARTLRLSLVVVPITAVQSGLLDSSLGNGGSGLKETMPDGWRIGIDCIYARLHRANIGFEPASEAANCTCLHDSHA